MRLGRVLFFLLVLATGAQAESRFALLIGNQNYSDKVGPLKNPHNDITLVGTALEKLSFNVTRIKDAGYREIDAALKRHIQQVRRAGKGTISFVYYSGHGAADPDTQINYLIPVDVSSADDAEVWTYSLDLKEVVNRLRDQSPDAVHYVIFDACREELRLTREGTKALERKGFTPVANISGVMVAYSTAPGKTASDAGDGGGVYAKTLANEIVKPGIESVMMFRNVQLKVKETIGQDPWLSFPTLPAVYFAGTKPVALTPEQQLELAYWLSVKDSTNPGVIETYLKRYPNGEFAAIARTLSEHFDRKLKAEQAAQEQERKRIDEERKAAEVRRLEEERRAREVAVAEEHARAEKDKDIAEAKRLEERHQVELVTRTEELRMAMEEARLAREAARAAEEQRLAAVKVAEEATRRAEETIALKRDAEAYTDPNKADALPKIETPSEKRQFDGRWTVLGRGQNCRRPTWSFGVTVANGSISGNSGLGPVSGSIDSSGKIHFTHPNSKGDKTNHYTGTVSGTQGSGTLQVVGGPCNGTFTVVRK